jgi:hypothetical protein
MNHPHRSKRTNGGSISAPRNTLADPPAVRTTQLFVGFDGPLQCRCTTDERPLPCPGSDRCGYRCARLTPPGFVE